MDDSEQKKMRQIIEAIWGRGLTRKEFQEALALWESDWRTFCLDEYIADDLPLKERERLWQKWLEKKYGPVIHH